MLKLDNNLLEELGLGSLPEDQKKGMLQHIYETLELRVGTQLANQMTDKQLQEFEQFIDAGGEESQAQALHWLETNLPNYKQVVNDVFEALKVEIKQMAPQIVAAAAGGSSGQLQDQAQGAVQQAGPADPAQSQPTTYPNAQPPAGPGADQQPPQYPPQQAA
jgi:hypothetical protein